MSTVSQTLLNAVSATGAGTAIDLTAVPRYQGGVHTVEVSGTFVGTVAFQGTIDGATWYSLGSTTAATMLAAIHGSFSKIRGNVTAYTSGSITMVVRYGLLQDLKSDIDTLLARLTSVRAGYLDELAAANLPTDITLLLTRLSNARAGYLDELAAANIPSDIDSLLTRLTSARAGYLDELSAANLPADIDTLLARLTAARALLLDNLATISTSSEITNLNKQFRKHGLRI